MSTQRFDQGEVPTDRAEGNGAETSLILRAANESLAKSPDAGPLPGLVPPTPSAPTALAGIPSTSTPPIPATPTAASGASPEVPPNLSRAHPSVPPSIPLARSTQEASAPPSSSGKIDPSSGAHNPGSRESYAFGEPRLEISSLVPAKNESGTPPAPPPACIESPAGTSGLPGVETVAQPEFYFLSERPAPRKAR